MESYLQQIVNDYKGLVEEHTGKQCILPKAETPHLEEDLNASPARFPAPKETPFSCPWCKVCLSTDEAIGKVQPEGLQEFLDKKEHLAKQQYEKTMKKKAEKEQRKLLEAQGEAAKAEEVVDEKVVTGMNCAGAPAISKAKTKAKMSATSGRKLQNKPKAKAYQIKEIFLRMTEECWLRSRPRS